MASVPEFLEFFANANLGRDSVSRNGIGSCQKFEMGQFEPTEMTSPKISFDTWF